MELIHGSIVAIRILIILISIIELALTASIFDFNVNYDNFYTLPDKEILIQKHLAWFFYFTIILAFVSQIIAFSNHVNLTTSAREQRKGLFERLEVISAMGLTVMAIVCSAISMSNAAHLSKFALIAVLTDSQKAAPWYYTRFYTSAVFCTMLAALSAIVLLTTLLRKRNFC
uniref:CASP-like protein n=1 Tax=Plectus sambesii TaxID=2011161 RepID=A0A914V492_9BILA